jgi:hypothetical protein
LQWDLRTVAIAVIASEAKQSFSYEIASSLRSTSAERLDSTSPTSFVAGSQWPYHTSAKLEFKKKGDQNALPLFLFYHCFLAISST